MWTIIAPHVDRTTANPAGSFDFLLGPAESTAEAIMEIRRRSGLTWQELGDLFDVSRRSIHHWANGKASQRRERSNDSTDADGDPPSRPGQPARHPRPVALGRPGYGGLATRPLAGRPIRRRHGPLSWATGRPSHTRVPLSPAARDARRPPAAYASSGGRAGTARHPGQGPHRSGLNALPGASG